MSWAQGKPRLSLGLILSESDQFCLVLVSSDPPRGSVVSSSTTVQSTRWEGKHPGSFTGPFDMETLCFSARV